MTVTIAITPPMRWRLMFWLALNRVAYRGRLVIVVYGLEPTPARGIPGVIDVLAITCLTPERLATSCRRP
jgi:hypothetical protein